MRPGPAAQVCSYEEVVAETGLSDCSGDDVDLLFDGVGSPANPAASAKRGASSKGRGNGGGRGSAKAMATTEKRSLLTDVDILVE